VGAVVSHAAIGKPLSIGLEDLTVAYDREPAVHHLTGTFAQGSMTAIVGPNGAGKSTLLKTIAGLLKADEGRVVRQGIKTRQIGYLPQIAEVDRSFPINVWDTVMLGLWNETGVLGGASQAQKDRVCDAIATVGLAAFEHRPVGTLSAGQFQRVMFARLVTQDARVILLDEPFAAVDERTSRDLLAIIEGWHGEGRTIIAVLHEVEQVRAHFPDCLLLARELVGWGPTASVLTSANLGRARHLAQHWHDHARHGGHQHVH
jgi:zinc/manganese transport system ATP-binding protein